MAASAKENNVRKIRKFGAGGSTEEDAQEARDKAAGLAASNAELERGDRKPSGFLGLGRFLEGNIDQKGSEAYEKYGAGYGRKIEAKNAEMKRITEREAAADAKQRSDKERDAGAAASEDDYETKNLNAGAKQFKFTAADNAAASAARAKEAAAGSGATTPGKDDKGARDTSRFKKSAAPAAAPKASAPAPAAETKAPAAAPKAAAETKAPAAETKAPAAETKAPAAAPKAAPEAAAETKAPAPSTTPEKGDGGGRDSSRFKKVSAPEATPAVLTRGITVPKAAAATKSVATSSDSIRERSSREEAYKKADAEARSPEGQAKRKKIIELQAIENFSPELEVAGGLGGLGLKAAAKLLKRGSGKGFFRKDPEFDYPRVRRGELPAPKKSDSANPSNLSLPKPASRLGLPRPKGDDIADVVAKRKGGSVQGYASGGSVAASSRGDGIAQRGKTRGRMR